MAQTRPRAGTNLQAPADSQIEKWKQEQAQATTRPVNVPTVQAPAQGNQAEAGSGKPLFRLSKVSIAGASALAQAQISAQYQPYLGREVTQADLLAIVGAITQEYRNAGYHLSRAIIPPQDLKGGHLRIQMIEGVIEEVVLKGDAAEAFGLKALLAPVSAERPSRLSTLERQLLLANDRAGVRLSDTTLEEIVTASGRFRLIVKAQAWRGFVAAGIDNNGTKAAGPWQASFGVALNSLIVPGDSLTFAGTTIPGSPREMVYGRAAYDMPIGPYGLRAGVSATHSEIRPGDARRQIRTVSRAETYELRLSAMPVLTQKHSLTLTGSIGISDIVEQNVFGPTFKDNIWLGTLSADYKLRATSDSWTFANASFRQGLGIVNPMPDSKDGMSRVGASPYFSALNASLTHYQNLIENWSLKLSAAGQLASGPLLDTQQFYLGGVSFGRGFETGWISGDRAIAGGAELRFDQPLKLAFAKSYQLFGFVEGGAVSTIYRPKNLVQGLASAGFGARLLLNDEMQLGLTIAKPLVYKSPLYKDMGVTVLFSLTSALRLCPDQAAWRCS